jgi:hypothetical protein
LIVAVPPPGIGRFMNGWLAVGFALIAPWVWLVVLDRVLRRTR